MKKPRKTRYESVVAQIEEETSFEEYLAALHEYKMAGLLEKFLEDESFGLEEKLEIFAADCIDAAVSDALYIERLGRIL